MCTVCGTDNDRGLHAQFLELEGGELLGLFTPDQEHQGYPGRLHGGVATTILDEAIGRSMNTVDHEVWGVTVELTVRFRKPVPLDSPVRALCRVTKDSSRLFEGSGEIILEDGTVAVEARGKFLKLPIEKIATEDFDHSQWYPDPRPFPDSVELPVAD